MTVLPVAPLLAETIMNVFADDSVSAIFGGENLSSWDRGLDGRDQKVSDTGGFGVRLQSRAVANERVKLVVQEQVDPRLCRDTPSAPAGVVLGVLYGREAPIAISIRERDLRSALTGVGGANAVLDVVVEGGKAHASVLKEYQLDAVRGNVTHVDLQEVRLDQPIHATVPLHLTGESAGTKEGGVLTQVLTELNVEALPMKVPALLDFDVSATTRRSPPIYRSRRRRRCR